MKLAQIYDLSGKLVITTTVTNEAINVEKLNSGTYLLLLRDDAGKVYSQKFIKE
jgi:hypothetical protein